MNKLWSSEAWEAAKPIFDEIIKLPFVVELASGTLPKDKFEFYLQQDSLYLHNYCRVLSHIASRLDKQSHTSAFIDFARDGVAVETAMHQVFLAECGPADYMSPTTMLYNSIQAAQALEPVELEVASILPCFWIYLEVGKKIAAMTCDGNPYSQWIATYSDEMFEASTVRAVAICDELAEKSSPEIRRRMTDIFVLCAKMEWLFWHSAYNLEKWMI